MKQTADELIRTVEDAAGFLKRIPESKASQSPLPAGWSRIQILGHLIDSASNNHQRFVRALQVSALEFPKYEQDQWVELQNYKNAPWPELVDLWRLYNRHLARIIESVPADKLETSCKIGPSEPMTLRELIEDYLRHLKHHVTQLQG